MKRKQKGQTKILLYVLTVASFAVMYAAKRVGTNPGATQFTRISGAISAARA